MARQGKIDREFFARYLESRFGASRDDVRKGPNPGVDFGVIDIGDQACVLSTDPVSILPQLGWERAGWFAMQFVLADVAVSGIPPTHLAISVSLPNEVDEDAFDRFWAGVDEACRKHDVAIVTGHTAYYPDADLPWVGSATGIGVGDPDAICYPDGATPGDRLLVTKGPAVEATGLLTTLFPAQIDLPTETLQTAQERLADTTVVADALAAADAGGVTAMHDATEGGLLGALFELATASDVRLAIDSDAVPSLPGVKATCEALDMDPWRAGSGGTLLIAVAPDRVDAILESLTKRDTPVAEIGRIEAGSGVLVDGSPQEPPAGDASWPVYERLLSE